jgi:hypothetical protein
VRGFADVSDGVQCFLAWPNCGLHWARGKDNPPLSDYTVGGVSVDLTYGFLNGKLNGLTMVFDGTFHQKIREMLIGKYGQPYEYTTTIYTSTNQYHNTVSHWNFREGFLGLTEVLLPLSHTGVLNFLPYTVPEPSQDSEAIQLRMLRKRTF